MPLRSLLAAFVFAVLVPASMLYAQEKPLDPRLAQATVAVKAAEVDLDRARLERDRAEFGAKSAASAEEKADRDATLVTREKDVQSREAALEQSKFALRDIELAIRKEELNAKSDASSAAAGSPAGLQKRNIDPDLPLSEILRQAEAGDAKAQFQAGLAFERLAKYHPMDPKEEEEWFNGGAEANRKQAQSWFEKASTGGNIHAQAHQERRLECAPKEQACWDRSLDMLAAGVEQKDGEALYLRSLIAQRMEKPEEQVRFVKEASEAGYGLASAQYALWMNEGKLVPRDVAGAQAIRVSLTAPGRREPEALILIGAAFESGFYGLTKDLAQAAAAYRLAAALSDAEGMYRLGHLVMAGNIPDQQSWIDRFDTAAHLGNIPAANELAWGFLEDRLTYNNDRDASVQRGIHFVRIAGAEGDYDAYAYAAHEFFFGYMAPRNPQLGLVFLNLALQAPKVSEDAITAKIVQLMAGKVMKRDVPAALALRDSSKTIGNGSIIRDFDMYYLIGLSGQDKLKVLLKQGLAGDPKAMTDFLNRFDKAKVDTGGGGLLGFMQGVNSVLQAANEGLAASRGVSNPATITFPTPGGFPAAGVRPGPLNCPDWSPHLEQILDSETDPTFRATLGRQKASQTGDRTVDVVARSGGLAQAKQLVRLQIQDYQLQLSQEGTATELGHAEMRDRLTRAINYNLAESELLDACR